MNRIQQGAPEEEKGPDGLGNGQTSPATHRTILPRYALPFFQEDFTCIAAAAELNEQAQQPPATVPELESLPFVEARKPLLPVQGTSMYVLARQIAGTSFQGPEGALGR